MKNEMMLEKDSYLKLIVKLCLPTIVIMLVTVLYNMADTYFIGQTGDANMVAAVSLCTPVFTIISGLATLIGNGGSTAISLALGRGEKDKVKSYSAFCFIGALVIGLLFAIAVLANTSFWCGLLGADAATLQYTMTYLQIIAVGAPVIMLASVFTNVIRADGSMVQAMISNFSGTIINIALDAILIGVFHMNVLGVALATVIGNIVSLIYVMNYIRKSEYYSVQTKYLHNFKDSAKTVLPLGLPLACSTLIMSVANIYANKLMVGYGNNAVAAQGVVSKAGMLISMIAMGICMAFGSAISYNFGKKNLKRVYNLIRNTAVFTVLSGTVVTILFFIFRDAFVRAFIDNEAVIAYAQIMIYAYLVTGPIYGLYQLCQVFLQSTGKAGYATIISLMDKGLVYIPVLIIMHKLFGMYGIVYASCVSFAVALVTGIVLSLKWNKEIKSEYGQETYTVLHTVSEN